MRHALLGERLLEVAVELRAFTCKPTAFDAIRLFLDGDLNGLAATREHGSFDQSIKTIERGFVLTGFAS